MASSANTLSLSEHFGDKRETSIEERGCEARGCLPDYLYSFLSMQNCCHFIKKEKNSNAETMPPPAVTWERLLVWRPGPPWPRWHPWPSPAPSLPPDLRVSWTESGQRRPPQAAETRGWTVRNGDKPFVGFSKVKTRGSSLAAPRDERARACQAA